MKIIIMILNRIKINIYFFIEKFFISLIYIFINIDLQKNIKLYFNNKYELNENNYLMGDRKSTRLNSSHSV